MSRERSQQNPIHSPVANGAEPVAVLRDNVQTAQDAQQSTLYCDILKTTGKTIAAGASVGSTFLLGETLVSHSVTMGMFEAGATTGGVGYLGYRLGRWMTSQPLPTDDDARGRELTGVFGWPIVLGISGISTFATTLDPWVLPLLSCSVGCCIGASQNWCNTAPENDAEPMPAPVVTSAIIVQQPTQTRTPATTVATATVVEQQTGISGQDNRLPRVANRG